MVKEKEYGRYQTNRLHDRLPRDGKRRNQLQKRWEMKIKMREDNDWNWYKIHRTPNNALIKENLRNVGRTGFKLAKDLEVGE